MLSSASVIAVSFYHWSLNVFSLFFFCFQLDLHPCNIYFLFSPFLLILASFFSLILFFNPVFFFLKKRSFLLLLWGHREVFALTFSVSLWCILFISPGFSTYLFSSSVPLTKFFVPFSYDDSLHGASCLLSVVWRGGAVVTGREEWLWRPPASLGFVALITLQQSVTLLWRVTPLSRAMKESGELIAQPPWSSVLWAGVCTFIVLPLSPSLHLWKVLWPVQILGRSMLALISKYSAS